MCSFSLLKLLNCTGRARWGGLDCIVAATVNRSGSSTMSQLKYRAYPLAITAVTVLASLGGAFHVK
jgi:hypothetical protein